MAEVAESQDVEARSVEGEVVEVNEANSLKKIKRKKINCCLYIYYIFFSPRDLSTKPRLGEKILDFLITLEKSLLKCNLIYYKASWIQNPNGAFDVRIRK